MICMSDSQLRGYTYSRGLGVPENEGGVLQSSKYRGLMARGTGAVEQDRQLTLSCLGQQCFPTSHLQVTA